MKGFRTVLSFTAFFAGLAFGSWMLQQLVPPVRIPEYSDKLDHLAQRGKSYDVVFIGSSRVRRQISPRVFDATLKEKGWDGRSFNFGMDGLGHPEMPYLIDQLLDLHLPRLRYVFLELTRFGREFGPLMQADSVRVLHWHTLPYTTMICRAIWDDPESRPASLRLANIAEHWQIYLRRQFHSGRGHDFLAQFYFGTSPARPNLGPEQSGFFPERATFPPAQLENYRRQVAEQSAKRGHAPVQDRVFEEATEEMLDKLRRRGITPIIITVPRIYPSPPWIPTSVTAPGDDRAARGFVLRFDDPAQHPELFDPRHHYDAQHLNAEGAELFSRQLAEKFWAETH